MIPKTYALYRGDEFLAVGTVRELAKMHGVREKTIRFFASRSHKERTSYEKAIWAYEVEEDEDERG